jgi:hypothetical protein
VRFIASFNLEKDVVLSLYVQNNNIYILRGGQEPFWILKDFRNASTFFGLWTTGVPQYILGMAQEHNEHNVSTSRAHCEHAVKGTACRSLMIAMQFKKVAARHA